MYRKLPMDMFPLIGKGRNVALTYLLSFRWKTIKQDIQKNKQQIVVSDMINKKTRQHIQVLFEGFWYERFFGRTEVMTELSITASPASTLIKKMLTLGIIYPMKGKGK